MSETTSEQQVGPEVAGGLIYAASTGRWPDFFATNDAALADIRVCAARGERGGDGGLADTQADTRGQR